MNFGRYSNLKDSGSEQIGDIPAHWSVKRLKFLISEPLKYGANEAAELTDPDLPRYVRITDVKDDGTLREETFRSLPLEVAKDYLLSDGDILFARSGATVGKSFIYRLEWGEAAYAGYLIRARMNEEMNADFAYLFLQSNCYWQWLNSIFIQATIQNVSAEKYGNLVLPVPPIEEQKKIILFLRFKTAQIDALIAKKKALLEKLAEKRTALISHAVTKGLDPTVPMKDSGVQWLGEVPAHWEVPLLGYVAEVRGGVTKGRKLPDEQTVELPYLRVANVQDGYVDLSHVAAIEILASEIPRYSLQKGDVLMNEGGDNDKLGRGAVWAGEIEPCLHQNHVFAVRPRIPELSSWLALLTQSSYAKFYFYSTAKQSTNLASISSSNIKRLPVLLPPVEERRAIIDHVNRSLSAIDKQREKVVSIIERLQEYRCSLITNAVTGKIDVRATSLSNVDRAVG